MYRILIHQAIDTFNYQFVLVKQYNKRISQK